MILVGDCLEVMRTLEPNSVDSIVTDPPYHLTSASRRGHARTNNPTMPHGRHRIGDKGFMGKVWDGGDIAFRVETWAEALRVAKPGAWLAAFGGTRTYHRLACAIEDAGWELRDCGIRGHAHEDVDWLAGWLYGSGFPKGTDKAKIPDEWQGFNTALKPAWEPIVLARKPMIGSLAENLLAHGTGALNIDACRIATAGDDDGRWGDGKRPGGFGDVGAAKGSSTPNGRKHDAGRWPANVVHDGSPEVLACFPDAPGQQGNLTGNEPSTPAKNVYGKMNRAPAALARGDIGSAARFFAQHQYSDEDWLWQHLSLANTAGGTLSLQNEAVASALKRAAIAALPEGRLCDVSTAPSTPVTPSELRQLAAALIETILSTGLGFWQGSLRAEPSLVESHAKSVAHRKQTGTTTIIVSHWKSSGCAEPVTFSITETSEGVGEAGFARFKYCAKASSEDRNDGCDGMERRLGPEAGGSRASEAGRRGGYGAPRENHHPTVKPTALMRWLCRLVTPPGGLVLDPFTGSGSTGRAAIAEGLRFTGIELDPEYAAIAEARIRAVQPGLALGAA